MPGSYTIITFDCYGTLIDWNAGIRGAFSTLADQAGVVIDPTWALEAYHANEPLVQSEAFRPYREVLAETARRAAAQIGWDMDASAAADFAASLPNWPAFPDTNAALMRMSQAGYRLGILSNVDDDLLAGTLAQFTVSIDLIITAQQVHSYKPAHGHFHTARERIAGAGWKGWLHAAQSLFHDISACNQLGIPAVWVNRLHELHGPEDPQPLATVLSLDELVTWLEN